MKKVDLGKGWVPIEADIEKGIWVQIVYLGDDPRKHWYRMEGSKTVKGRQLIEGELIGR